MFHYDETTKLMTALKSAGADLIAIICDGNKVTKSFFRHFYFNTVQPWRTTYGNFLFYDLVHILKISGTVGLQK